MTKTSLLTRLARHKVKIGGLFLVLLFLWLGLNYQQLYSLWLIKSEMKRLTDLAAQSPSEFQNPPPVQDRFEGKLSSDFWKFTTINGAGKVSNEMSWHSAAIQVNRALTIQNFHDPTLKNEDPDWHVPAADQYNNVSLVGGSGFRPSASGDVVLKFTMRVSEGFYGSAGVIFQQAGTLQKDGSFAKPFDMFGLTLVGKDSSVLGVSGPVCYLALGLFPVQAQPIQTDIYSLHTYEIRLHWVNRTEWLGSLKVDDATQCQIAMPAFGAVDVHVWSDNAWVVSKPRRWWEIAPAMESGYRDGGDKQFSLGMIQILEEKR